MVASYRRRICTVEPVFGIVKSVLGFIRFPLRSLDDVELEWPLVTRAHNCKCLDNLGIA